MPKASAVPREPVDVRLQRAVTHAWSKKPDLAHAELDGVLEEAPLYRSARILQACLFLEEGKLDAAARAVAHLRELDPGDPETRMLAALIDQRRLQPKGSWLGAMRQAWIDVGRPWLDLKGGRMELVPEMQDVIAIVWARTEDVEDRFIAMLTADASDAQEQWLMDHLSGLKNPALKVAAFEYFHNRVGPHEKVRARKRGRDLLRPEMVEMAARSERSDLPLLLLLGETSERVPLTQEEVRELERIAELPRYCSTRMAALGDDARWRLEPLGVRYPDWKFYWAAMGTRLIRAPWKLLEVTKERLTPEERLRLGAALLKLGGRIAEGNTIEESWRGAQLMEQGALLKGDEAGRALAVAAVKRNENGVLANSHVSFELWLLPSFQREWVEASLYDEKRLTESLLAR
ncbi:hypothetical protein HMI51_10005 [Corallococcus coralloides]|nr:hypothetical protein [Corallococcus coralloides]